MSNDNISYAIRRICDLRSPKVSASKAAGPSNPGAGLTFCADQKRRIGYK